MLVETFSNESVTVYMILEIEEEECECWYDEDGEVVEYCNKNVCPNL